MATISSKLSLIPHSISARDNVAASVGKRRSIFASVTRLISVSYTRDKYRSPWNPIRVPDLFSRLFRTLYSHDGKLYFTLGLERGINCDLSHTLQISDYYIAIAISLSRRILFCIGDSRAGKLHFAFRSELPIIATRMLLSRNYRDR